MRRKATSRCASAGSRDKTDSFEGDNREFSTRGLYQTVTRVKEGGGLKEGEVREKRRRRVRRTPQQEPERRSLFSRRQRGVLPGVDRLF